MKTLKSVGKILIFAALAQVPAMAVWFNQAIPEKIKVGLVTVLSAIFLVGIVENFRKTLNLNYQDIGVKLPSAEKIKQNVLYAIATGIAGLIWFAIYIHGMKFAFPALYNKLATTKSVGYVSALIDWGRTQSFTGLIALPLGMLIIVAGEELLCRGLIFNYIRREETETKALLWSSGLFALVHLNPVNMPVTFVMGLLFAWLYKKSNSLLIPIIAHLTYNLGIALLGPILHS